MEEFPYRERARWASCAMRRVELGLGGSTSQLTLGRSPGRAAGPRPRGTNLKMCPGRDGGMGCRRVHLEVHRAVGRVPWTLTPSLSRVHPGAVHPMSFCGRGSPRAAGPRASHRSDSPTSARRVGSGGLRPRKERGESGEERFEAGAGGGVGAELSAATSKPATQGRLKNSQGIAVKKGGDGWGWAG